MLKDRGDYRNIAIHLMKKWTSITNKKIGDLSGGLSFAAVSKANQRFIMRLRKDIKLRRRVDDIVRNMSHIISGADPLFPRELLGDYFSGEE